MPVLHRQQVEALRALEWLLSDAQDGPAGAPRRSGRTVVMALAFLRFAFGHPGRWVRVHDHMAHIAPLHAYRVVLEYIQGWARAADVGIEIDQGGHSFLVPGTSVDRFAAYLRVLWMQPGDVGSPASFWTDAVAGLPPPEWGTGRPVPDEPELRRTAWEHLDGDPEEP